MSEENVDQARRGYDALNRRDLDAFLALMDPEVEFTTRFAQMEGGPSTAVTTVFANGGKTCSPFSPTSALRS